MIDINVKGLLYVSNHHPTNDRKKSGHINIGSTAAKKFIQTGMYIVLQNMRLTLKECVWI
jgi:NADP-dependent 3-hydroxy acid dehydrogenase YdfG